MSNTAIAHDTNLDLLNFVETIKANTTLYKAVEKIKSVADLVNLGKKHGYSFTENDFTNEAAGYGELRKEDLMNVVGGSLEEVATGASTCPCSWQD